MSKRDARKGYAKAVSRLAPGWLAWPQLAGVARTRDRTPAEVVRKLDLSAGSAPSAAGPRQWRDQADEAWGRASAAPTVPDEPAGQSPEPSPRVNILDSEPDQVSGGATLQSSLPQKPPHNESLSSVLRFAAVVHLCLLLIIAWSVAARLLPFNPPPHVALLNALRECKQLLSPVPLASFLTSSASGFATACAAEGAIATCFAAVIFVVCSFACLRSAALEEWAVVSRALQSCYAQQRELAQQLLEARVLNQQLLQRIEEVTPASTPVAMSPAPASVAASAQTTGEAHNVAAAPQTRPSRGYGSPAPLLATPARGAGTDGAAAPSVPVTPAAVTLKGWGRDGFVFESPGGGPRMCLKLMPQT
ncbi:hypothetical protein T484DRAFT_3156127 [Baffinella frigidus]|nr:hypothetical protein T484DRAFT_3156127 [Cryptophyta sp. CCMP2293]